MGKDNCILLVIDFLTILSHLPHSFFSYPFMKLQVVVNGVGGASGDQDTENTELMAIYTKDIQGAEKVSRENLKATEAVTLACFVATWCCFKWHIKPSFMCTWSRACEYTYSHSYRLKLVRSDFA